MTTDRLEAFSDGVFAIIITVMVLELPRPGGRDWSELLHVWPAFLVYVLSFVFLGIAWVNHHHLFRAAHQRSNNLIWANFNLLFWLSLLPFVTDWAGETQFAPIPMTVYAADALLCAGAFSLLIHVLKQDPGNQSQDLSSRSRVTASLVAHVVAVVAPLINPAGVWVSGLCLFFVALTWLVPNRHTGQRLSRDQ